MTPALSEAFEQTVVGLIQDHVDLKLSDLHQKLSLVLQELGEIKRALATRSSPLVEEAIGTKQLSAALGVSPRELRRMRHIPGTVPQADFVIGNARPRWRLSTVRAFLDDLAGRQEPT